MEIDSSVLGLLGIPFKQ